MGEAALHEWLEQLVKDRVSKRLALRTIGKRVRIFCADGANGFIDLPFWEWGIGKTVKGCAWFSAEAEGWPLPMRQPVPAPGVDHLRSPLIKKIDNGYMIHYDLLGLAYWMLTRLEEIESANLDNHGRFPATASHAFTYGYLERPIVDEWFVILREVATRVWPQLPLVETKFKISVSHDVDRPSRFAFQSPRHLLRAICGDVLKRCHFISLLHGPLVWLNSANKLHPVDPYNTFDWIMDMSECHGLTSSFYFICGRTEPSFDAVYEIEHPAIRDLLRRIYKRGHKIGLHPSYNTYRNPDLIASELQRLRRVCAEEGIDQLEWGGRMHYLRWESPITMRALEWAGMAYDNTLGFCDRPGFRCGTCFEYPAFDPLEGRTLRLRIRPLIAMESTVMAQECLGLGVTDAARNKFLQLKHSCRVVGGTFSLLWHNSTLSTLREREIYETILES